MKNLILFAMVFVCLNTFAQTKTRCFLTENTKNAREFYPERGERILTVQPGEELWVQMSPSASHNRKENGGCTLMEGQQYVVDANGYPIRAYLCGNAIVRYQFRSVDSGSSQQGHTLLTQKDCNCPSDDRYQSKTLVFNDTGSGQRYFYRANQDQFEIDPNQFVIKKEKSWFGRNWGWVVPLGVAIIGGTIYAIDELSSNDNNNQRPSEDETWGPLDNKSYQSGNHPYQVRQPRGIIIPLGI